MHRATAPQATFRGAGYSYALVAACERVIGEHRHVRVDAGEPLCAALATWCDRCGSPRRVAAAPCNGCAHLGAGEINKTGD